MCREAVTDGIGDRSFFKELYVLHAVRLVMIMRAFSLTHLLGVFDARMIRIYRRLGWAPT